jgi:hypothetical protein
MMEEIKEHMEEIKEPMAGAGGVMSAARAVRTAVRGYEEYVDKRGRKVRVYGGLNGMTPSEHDDWWHKRGKYATKKASPPKVSAPPLRRSLRLAEKEAKKRRMSMGGSRKSRKNGKTRKSRK